MNILELSMGTNDAKAKTIRGYLKSLLSELWREEESFSGKRPFGNSGWQWEVYRALIDGGAVPGKSSDGDVDFADYSTGRAMADVLIQKAIAEL